MNKTRISQSGQSFIAKPRVSQIKGLYDKNYNLNNSSKMNYISGIVALDEHPIFNGKTIFKTVALAGMLILGMLIYGYLNSEKVTQRDFIQKIEKRPILP